MRRLILAVGLVLFASAAIARPIEYGLKAGICLSTQDFDLSSGNEFITGQRIGPEFGFFVEFYPPKDFSFTASIMLTERGMKSDLVLDSIGKGGSQIIETSEENNHINYISAMIALKKRFAIASGSAYLLAGPRLDIRYGSGGHDAITVVYDDSKRIVAGLAGGVGWEIKLKRRKRLFFEAIYNYDLSDAYSGTELTIKNRSLSVLVGLKL